MSFKMNLLFFAVLSVALITNITMLHAGIIPKVGFPVTVLAGAAWCHCSFLLLRNHIFNGKR